MYKSHRWPPQNRKWEGKWFPHICWQSIDKLVPQVGNCVWTLSLWRWTQPSKPKLNGKFAISTGSNRGPKLSNLKACISCLKLFKFGPFLAISSPVQAKSLRYKECDLVKDNSSVGENYTQTMNVFFLLELRDCWDCPRFWYLILRDF